MSHKVVEAATVDNHVIDEADVTAYIEGFRSEDESRETDSGWAQYLASSGYTAESFRAYVLDTVFIPNVVTRIKASELGLDVTDDELDAVIAAEKEYYENRYGADTWVSVLGSYGYDEASWRESEMNRLLRERLTAKVVGTIEPTYDQIIESFPEVAPSYNGKHSYYVAFDSAEAAEEALAELGGAGSAVDVPAFKRMGRSYASAAKEEAIEKLQEDEGEPEPDERGYKQVDGPVNAGWSSLVAMDKIQNPAYNNALNDLSENTVSGVVDLEDGSWLLILCDKTYIFESGDIYDADRIPKAIYKKVVKDISAQLQRDEFDQWLQARRAECSVVINEMPMGLTYDVNRRFSH